MPIVVNGSKFDTMSEACHRLGISRQTMLRCLKDAFFTEPKLHRQGREKMVRYFDNDWYTMNEPRLKSPPAAPD